MFRMSKSKRQEKAEAVEEQKGQSQKEQKSSEEAVNESNNSEEQSSEVDETTEETKKAKEQEDYKDRYLRLFAEFENFRKRTSRERLELFASANQELMTALLPVLDDFDRASKQLPNDENAKTYVEGLELIRGKFHKTLVSKGLKSMEIEAGEAFDVDRMEAITKIPAPSDELKGKVVDVIEQGFKLGDKIIRYARVVVGE
jgi:molecular chaperone GrpE